MTLCIAATCNGGERIVTATDGLISSGEVTGECVLAKMRWLGDWLLMYAGTPANSAMVCDCIGKVASVDIDVLSAMNVKDTVRSAYVSVRSMQASFAVLSPFNLTMDQFMTDGLSMFTEQSHGELVRRISDEGTRYDEQLLVTGWGESPKSAMVYELGPTGEWLHNDTGFCAIGSGTQMAHTMLTLLGQARHITLAV